MSFHSVFAGAAIFFILFFSALAFWLQKRGASRVAPSFFLVLTALILGLGGAELLSWQIERAAARKAQVPETPDYLRFNETPHMLIKDSILYAIPTNHEYRALGYKYTSNGMGFREKNFSLKKPPDVFRILVFGDSLTFGMAIDDDHRYSNVLEDMMNSLKVYAGEQTVETLNFGMSGYATDQERDLMEVALKFVECDLVAVGFFWNDLTVTTRSLLKSYAYKDSNLAAPFLDLPVFANPRRTFDTIPQDMPQEYRAARPWHGDSYLYQLLRSRTNLFIDEGIPSPALWNYVFNEFLEMKKLTEQRHLPPPVVLLMNHGFVDPRQNDFRSPVGDLARNIATYRFVGEKLTQAGFIVADTLPGFQKHSFMSMGVSEWDRHPNYLAHYIYAETLAETIAHGNTGYRAATPPQ